MSYYQVFYHVVWATKGREALITSQIEPVIFDTIRRKSVKFQSPIHAINGIADHIHVAVSIPPSYAVAE